MLKMNLSYICLNMMYMSDVSTHEYMCVRRFICIQIEVIEGMSLGYHGDLEDEYFFTFDSLKKKCISWKTTVCACCSILQCVAV